MAQHITLWVPLAHYQGHEISPSGEIRNAASKQILKTSVNQTNVRYVAIRNTTLNHYENKAVGVLVAETYCERFNTTDETVLYLDGNKDNNEASNLMWATRWHAMAYHQEIVKELPPGRRKRIRDGQGNVYKDTRQAAMSTGCTPSAIDYAARYNEALGRDAHINFVHYTYPGGHAFFYDN